MELIKKTITEDGVKYEYYVDEQGRKQGECIARYSLGAVEVANYKDDKQHGETIWYNSDGKITEKASYKDDKRNGETIWCNPIGVITERANYKDDKRHGKTIWYDSNGEEVVTIKYENGEKISHN